MSTLQPIRKSRRLNQLSLKLIPLQPIRKSRRLNQLSLKFIPLDPLKHIISFLDWTCDLDTFNDVINVLNLSIGERDQILEYWKNHTRFRTDVDINKKVHWINDKIHRTDGPAVEWSNGDREWWVNGKLHRIDGPAKEYANGLKKWYKNNKLHRNGGPAVEHDNGIAEYWRDGDRHRVDGPAKIDEDGNKEWWIYGWKQSRRKFYGGPTEK